MASSGGEIPGLVPEKGEPIPPGKLMSTEQRFLDKGAQMMQSLKPVNEIKQHVCTFALYSQDLTRQIETHHYLTRLNQDFIQCAVYDTDDSHGRLIETRGEGRGRGRRGRKEEGGGCELAIAAYRLAAGRRSRPIVARSSSSQQLHRRRLRLQEALENFGGVGASIQVSAGVEYIITDRIFETLPPDEQKLWHSHAYEIKSGLWVNPQVPELVLKPELENLTKTYGKFWCTWQVDRGDRLPLGPPSLMMSPQPVNLGKVRPHLVEKRDYKYKISIDDLKMSRVEIEEPEWINPQADNWKQHGKGFVILVEPIEMKKMAPFP
ncbi:hypothetical protein TEA_020105 [Camellia sinensis var. sinensis]|uniref:Uncharacterized protein n=1 Tax=Camellia sinensis var. sinensis TaxID=542762 RepID=A0A4S4D7Z2_CAMSN|nr:hypothetical protein TEA_020105 [Camellia sinensis var. sinensis]